MQEAIEKNKDVRWKVVAFHHSIYSVANHAIESDILQRRNELAPVFDELGIDVVLMGHDHVYVRSHIM
ncbi:MAG: metallophosphoesterase, partial [Faecalibacillus sp.]